MLFPGVKSREVAGGVRIMLSEMMQIDLWLADTRIQDK
jgi:hypothetical protein